MRQPSISMRLWGGFAKEIALRTFLGLVLGIHLGIAVGVKFFPGFLELDSWGWFWVVLFPALHIFGAMRWQSAQHEFFERRGVMRMSIWCGLFYGLFLPSIPSLLR